MGHQRGTMRPRVRRSDGTKPTLKDRGAAARARKRTQELEVQEKGFRFEVPEDDPLTLAEEDEEQQEREELAGVDEYYAEKELAKKKKRKAEPEELDPEEAALEAALDRYEEQIKLSAENKDVEDEDDEDEEEGEEEEDEEEEEGEEDEEEGEDDEEEEEESHGEFDLPDDLLDAMSEE